MAATAAAVGMVRSRGQRWSGQVLLWVTLILTILFAFFPIYWMAITSVTPRDQVFRFPPRFLPETVTLEFYGDFFNNPALSRYLFNSLLVSSVTAISSLAIGVYAGYSFSKFRYRGRRGLMFLILSARCFRKRCCSSAST